MGACWLGGFVAFVFFRLLFNRIFSKKSPIYLISSATPLRRRNNSRAGLFVVLLVVGAIAVVELSVVATGGFSALLDMTSARLAKADDSFVLLVGLLFLIPALVSIFAFELKLRNFWLVWLVVLIVAGLGGGRGATFVLFFIAILRLILINYRKISITWLFAGMIPATFAMYLYTNIVRFRGSDGGGDSGIFDFLLNSETFAAWKSLAAVIELDFRMPYPGYSLFSAVFYPLPRAIVPFKPDPPSSLFTMQISPTRFANTNSEITISGMGDMIANFGLIAGPIVFGFLLAFLASFACRLRSNGAGPGTAIYVALIIFTMTFFRADIFGASRILWFLALIVILQRSLGGLLTLLRRR
jgi:oligosaccharide repeat unit polymerase